MEGGATYFSLNQPAHWQRRGVGYNLEPEEGLAIRRGEKYGVLETMQLENLDGVGEVTAFAVNPQGHFVLLNVDGDVWTYDRGSRHHERLFVPGHNLFSASAKLAITGDILFVADSAGEPSLSAYDMANGQLRFRTTGERMEDIPFYPLAIHSDACLFIRTDLARSSGTGRCRRRVRHEKARAHPNDLVGQSGQRIYGREIGRQAAGSTGLWQSTQHISTSKEGVTYVLDSVSSSIIRHRDGPTGR